MKYKVWAYWTNAQKWEIEADSEEEALDKATDGDGNLIWEGWDLDSVELCENDK